MALTSLLVCFGWVVAVFTGLSPGSFAVSAGALPEPHPFSQTRVSNSPHAADRRYDGVLFMCKRPR